MSSLRPALMAAIRAAPDDDAPRLIAADWFEEQGSDADVARAEFIRNQVESARLPPEDLRQSELRARALRLLKRYAPAWCGGTHFAFRKVRFRRGFIEQVHLHLTHFLHHRRQLLALEPVRDVSLTGWYRAPDHLIRRVAACEEWREIETLRIHHQGPHHDPRSNVLLLLESPHLTRLRTLRCPGVQFDADARRRFEVLPVLRRVAELSLPLLQFGREGPGGWFSDGGIVHAAEWKKLRSLTLPFYAPFDFLRQLTELPFWNRLTFLRLGGPFQTTEGLALLRDRLPPSLRELFLSARYSQPNFSSPDSFFDRLAQAPLESLSLDDFPLSVASLGRLLDGTNPCSLRELTLSGSEFSEDHARTIATLVGARNLRSLSIRPLDGLFTGAAARALFSNPWGQSLVHLDLAYSEMGTEGAMALATAPGFERLRSLNVSGASLSGEALQSLIRSGKLRRLNFLAIGYEDALAAPITPELANELTHLPNLVELKLHVCRCDAQLRQVLLRSPSLAWIAIVEDVDLSEEEKSRAYRAPENWPPLDPEWE